MFTYARTHSLSHGQPVNRTPSAANRRRRPEEHNTAQNSFDDFQTVTAAQLWSTGGKETKSFSNRRHYNTHLMVPRLQQQQPALRNILYT